MFRRASQVLASFSEMLSPVGCACAILSATAVVLSSCAPSTPPASTPLAQTAIVQQYQATINAALTEVEVVHALPVLPTLGPATPRPTALETPTATATSTPFPGVLERASFDMAADWGPPHMGDDFEDPIGGVFSSHDIGTSKSWYGDDGRYHISDSTRGRFVWFWSFPTLANFYADVIVINGPSCNDRDSGGMLFRGSQALNEGYIFGVTCAGHFHIGFKGGPNPGNAICSVSDAVSWNCSSLTSLHETEHSNPGPGAMNRIGVYAHGNLLDFYINGRWVYQISTNDFAHFYAGTFALYLGTFQKDLAEVGFENFGIWSIP